MTLATIDISRLAIFITAVATFLSTLTGFILAFKKIGTVHVLVNQRMTDVLARVDQLTTALEDEGKEVPPDPAERPR